MLFINSVNITTCICYWSVLLTIYGLTFALVADHATAGILLKILLYSIPAKGCSGVLVWVLVTSYSFTSGEAEDEEGEVTLDLNTALREEVLMYVRENVNMNKM